MTIDKLVGDSFCKHDNVDWNNVLKCVIFILSDLQRQFFNKRKISALINLE